MDQARWAFYVHSTGKQPSLRVLYDQWTSVPLNDAVPRDVELTQFSTIKRDLSSTLSYVHNCSRRRP